MKFLVFVKLTGQGLVDYEHGRMPTQEEISRMMTYNQELADAGVMIGGDGLHPSAKTITVTFGESKPVVSDGPFAEAKELIGGYWIWNVASREEAMSWAERCPMQAGDVLELRQVFDYEDFGDAIGPAEQAQIDDVNSKIAAATS